MHGNYKRCQNLSKSILKAGNYNSLVDTLYVKYEAKMFTSGRKHENLYIGFFQYAESISNRIHACKPKDPTQNQEIQDGRTAYSNFYSSSELWFYLT
jgi:hypothetical protein